MQEIDRLEADSKFFRSVTVVLAVFVIIAATRPSSGWAVASASALLLLSFGDLRISGGKVRSPPTCA
jgi:hypothetical protein